MRSNYERPVIEFEDFVADAAIASGCERTVSLGPGGEGYDVCKEYADTFDDARRRTMSVSETSFYDDMTCSCYLSAGDPTIFTS